MENKIIKEFPLEQLNTVLGGIKQNTFYYFFFQLYENEKVNSINEIITGIRGIETDTVKSAETFYKNFFMSFDELTRKENILLINLNDEISKVIEYFKNKPEVDINYLYDKYDIYDFMNLLNSTPVSDELNYKINKNAEKQGSIILFQFANEEKEIIEELFFPDIPMTYKKINIDCFAGGYLFDFITEKTKDGIKHEYSYLFFIKDKENISGKIENEEICLLKTLTFDINDYKKNLEYFKKGVNTTYTFHKKFNIKTFIISD